MNEFSFERAFFADMRLDASVYLDAGMSPVVPPAIVPPPADLARIEGYQYRAKEMGYCNGDFTEWSLKVAVVNITQRVEFMDLRASPVMPTLLRKSILWDLVRDEMVHPAVHWIVMGFPHPAFLPPGQLADQFPFTNIVLRSVETGGLKLSAQLALQGNSMHWAAAAASLCYGLGCTSKSIWI